jgi:hypothetical protein
MQSGYKSGTIGKLHGWGQGPAKHGTRISRANAARSDNCLQPHLWAVGEGDDYGRRMRSHTRHSAAVPTQRRDI